MTPPISYASLKLGYPLYQLEFDPYGRGYLLVGGGGGGGKAGVPNKLNLVDVSSRASLTSVADITLSSDEDSVSSLASLATKDGLTTFAGVSSSVNDRSSGKNEHFRSFDVKFPKRTRAQAVKDGDKTEDGDLSVAQSGAFKSLDRARLLSPKAATGKYMNQKLLRLSPIASREKSTRRIGALSSCDSEASEIAIFDATSQTPNAASVRHAIDLEGKDAQDLDIWQSSEGSFALVYCTNFAVHVQDLTYDFAKKQVKLSTDAPFEIHKTTEPGIEFRCCRWLSPKHVLITCNNRSKKTTQLLVLTVDRSSKKGKVTARRALWGNTKTLNTLDTCQLDADLVTGERQILAATAGPDGSVHIFAMDYTPALQDSAAQIKSIRHFESLQEVHGGAGIAKVAFAPFFPPQQPSNSPTSVASAPSYARLASVAVFNDAVVVESIALTSTPTSPFLASEITGTQKKIPAVRWVLSSASAERMRSWAGLLLIAFVVLVSAFLLQAYFNADSRMLDTLRSMRQFDAPGAMPPHQVRESLRQATAHAPPSVKLSASSFADRAASVASEAMKSASSVASQATATVSAAAEDDGPASVRSVLDRASQAIPPEAEPTDAKAASLSDLLAAHTEEGNDGQTLRKAVVLMPHGDDGDGVHVGVHEHNEVHEAVQQVRRFEELSIEQRDRWKARLVRAGRWTADEGETVLKSLLFSEYAAVVGGALRDAVLNN